MRFHREYELRVLVSGGTVTIANPFRIQFEATKSIAGFGLNKLTAKLFGLSEQLREYFVKDAEERKFLRVELRAGYRGNVKKIFTGDLHRGANKLTANGFETLFECFDGGYDYINSYTARTVTGKQNTVNAVLEDMPNTDKGKVTDFPQLIRPKVLMGASSKVIEDFIGPDESFYIEDGRLNIIKDDEIVSSFIPVVNNRTGLIGTPEREFSKVTFETLMNPDIIPGERVSLESIAAKHLNAIYRVDAITYSGDTEGNDWKQKITGFIDRGSTLV